jgi:iron-sulfur cluster repair protein YtfE (RIC family)
MFVSIGQKRRAPAGLIELLLECHGRIRSFVGLARQLGSSSGVPPSELSEGCLRCERYFTEALPLHVLDEEESLLPRLQGLRPELDAALERMHREHLAHDALVAALLGACRALREHPTDPVHRDALARAATQLSAEFDEHLAREEELIFPAVRTLLSPPAQTEAMNELRSRRNALAP